MTNLSKAQRIVKGCKERLKTETDPIARQRIAIIGEEFNKLAIELKGIDPVCKCAKCHRELPQSSFAIVIGWRYYTKKDGKVSRYKASCRRKKCNQCTFKRPRKKEQSAFVVGGIRVY